MAEKVASVKLTLNGSTYLGQLKELGEENVKQAAKAESAWKRVGVAGLGAFRKAASDTVASVKSTLSMVAGLGGAVTLGGAVKGALDSRSAFKALAFDVQAASGETIDYAAVMRDAQQEAIKWGVSAKELGGVFKEAMAETKDQDFAREAMRAAAVTARGTGASLETLGTIAGALGDKFNVSDGDIADGLAVAYSMVRQTNVPLEEMEGIIDKLGSSAKSLGIQGVGGFERVMGLASIAKDAAKGIRPALSATMQLMEQMGDPSHRKKMMLAFGVETKGKDWEQGLADIIAKTGGKKELLAKGFEGEQLKVVTALGDVFRTTFEESTGTAKQKTKAALDALHATISEAGTSNMNAANIAEEAAKRVQSPSAQMAIAMERLTAEFTRPELMNGLIRLAKVAPEAANKLAGLLEFAFNHPAMAAGIYAGMKLGAPAIKAALSEGASVIGDKLKVAVVEAMAGKGGGFGAGGGALGTLGRVGAVAAAGLVGVEAGQALSENIDKNVVEPTQKRRAALQSATITTELNTTGRFNVDSARESLANLRARLDQAKRDREFSWQDVTTFGLRRLSTASDKEIARGERAYAEGEAALRARMAKSAESAAEEVRGMAVAAREASAVFRGMAAPGGGAGGKGPMRPPPVTPGYNPR